MAHQGHFEGLDVILKRKPVFQEEVPYLYNMNVGIDAIWNNNIIIIIIITIITITIIIIIIIIIITTIRQP